MSNLFDLDLFQAIIRISTPLVLAGLGGLLTFNAGVLNIAMDGFMLMAAFAAVWMVNVTGNLLAGIAAAVVAGLLIATVFGYFNLKFKANIFITGIAVNLLASSLTALLLVGVLHQEGSFVPTNLPTIPTITFPVIDRFSTINAAINSYDPFVYLTVVLVPVTWFVLYHTSWGLHVRAVGENDEAAEAVGINAFWIRMQTIWLSGALCGVAGAYLSLVYVGSFSRDMTADRGLIALAAIFFAGGAPIPMTLVALLFGAAQALAIRLQIVEQIAPQLLQLIPYVLTVLALVGVGIRARYFRRATRGITLSS